MNSDVSLSLCAVIVSYEPDQVVLLRLLNQLDKDTDFIVVDNGSKGIDGTLEEIIKIGSCKKIIKLAKNEGLAAALNRGIKWVQESSYKAVLLFDQDSGLCSCFVEKMILAYNEARKRSEHEIGVIGPRLINPESGKKTKFKVFNRFFFRSDRPFSGSKLLFNTDFLITSGSLIPISSLAKIGLMKESYFIDNIDLEWCFRAKSKGFEIVGADYASLLHVIGEGGEGLFVKSGLMVQHKPERSYYTSRNRLDLYRLPYSPLGWKLRDVLRFFVKTLWLIISSPERKQYIKNIIAGIRDSKSLY